MSELDDKIARLPAWAREHIKRLTLSAEPNIEEMIRLRREKDALEEKVRRMSTRIDAMVDVFTCAGRGGNETAQAFVDRIIELYKGEPDVA